MASALEVLSVITALLATIYAYYKWTYGYWKRRNVPYIEPTIPFGSSGNPWKRTTSLGNLFRSIYEQAKSKSWKHCGMYFILSKSYMVVDLELLKHVMTKDFNYFTDRGLYTNEKDDPIGCHLFALGGKKWRNLRVKLTPTFTSGKLKSMFQTLVDCGLLLEKYTDEYTDTKEAVDIKDIFGRFSTDIIGSCAFGLDCNNFKEPDSPFRIYGQKFFSQSNFGILKTVFTLNFPNFSRAIGLRQVSKDISDFFTKTVVDTIAYRERNNVTRKDFLQLLIDIKNNREGQEDGHKGDGKSLTMDEVVAQSFVFFIAGFETSSTAATFALYELATHQDLQDKVRNEIKTVLAKHNEQITYDSLSDLKYMKQVIDESLRMYPPLPFITRQCVEDYKLPGEDVIIEKGTRVHIPVLGIHYDEEYYPNPNVFDLERFNEENSKKRHQYAHIPFGEGPRICIGERFGIMQTKVGLTCLLRKYKVTLNEKTQLPIRMSKDTFISCAEGGIWLNFEKV